MWDSSNLSESRGFDYSDELVIALFPELDSFLACRLQIQTLLEKEILFDVFIPIFKEE